MNKVKEARLNMFDAVIAYCNNNAATVASIPAFQSAFTNFQNAVSGIHLTAQQEADVIIGITADKAQLRLNLCKQTAELAAVVFAFASSSSNNELKEKVNFSFSNLKRLKDKSLIAACTNIRDSAQANLAGLAPYGVTATSITDFQNAIDAYAAKTSSPRNAVSQRSYYKQSLNDLFSQASNILRTQLDKMIVQFKATNESFYQVYKNNRMIVEPATSATQIIGRVMSAGNNEPVVGATVQFVSNGLSDITNANGNFILKSAPVGTQSIKITKEGFVDSVEENILVKLGKTATIEAVVNPVAA